jgi:beta-lactamase regulating signal transducer with metallopeptidase domain
MSDQALTFVDWLNRSAETWWQCFGTAAWQAGLVALLGIALVRLRRNWSAPVRYGILLLCLLKFALAPLLLIPSRTNDLLTIEFTRPRAAVFQIDQAPAPRPSSPPAVMTQPAVENSMPARRTMLPKPAANREDSRVWSLISLRGWGWLLHLCGSIVIILGLLRQWLGLWVLVYGRSTPADAQVQALADRIRKELRYRRRAQIRVSPRAPAPIAFGSLVPTVVLPAQTVARLSSDDLGAVLAHEIAHLRRRDPLVNTMQILLAGIWWFHPVYWLLTRQIRRVREDCCDDLVLTRQIAPGDRYCQILLDAARASRCATTGGAVLGFGESGQSLRQRLLRIVNPRSHKAARVGILAGLALIALALVTLPMWRSGSTLDNPRPVTAASYGPGKLESIGVAMNLRDHPRLSLDPGQEAALKACFETSRLVLSVTGKTTPEARDKLLDLQKTMSPSFYPEFLLAQWYRRNGQPDEADRWMSRSLANAPVVLVRKYQFMDGRPLANTEVGTLGVECRMKTATSSNAYQVLEYPGLVTDGKGRVQLPCYDTKIRSNGVQWPKGYEIETGRHGYLELHGRYCLLPTIYVWEKGSPRPATTLPASSFYDYRNAQQAQGLKHSVGGTEFRIERCFRSAADGSILATDGRVPLTDHPNAKAPLMPQPHESLDQAVISFQRSRLSGHEIIQVRIFDHRSRALLTKYHAPADWDYAGADEIRLKSFGRPLPDRVDVWFMVASFGAQDKKQIVPAKVGSSATFENYKAVVTHVHDGRRGYSINQGKISFNPPRSESRDGLQVAFQISPRARADKGSYARVAAVTTDGMRLFEDRVVYARNRHFLADFPFEMKRLSHFELYPVGRETSFFFDGVRLPESEQRSLAQTWATVIRTEGREGRFTSDPAGPAQFAVTVLPGRNSMSSSSSFGGLDLRPVMQWTYGQENRDMDTRATVVSEMRGLSSRMLRTELEALGADGEVLDSNEGGSFGPAHVYFVFRTPPSRIHAVRVRLTWSSED